MALKRKYVDSHWLIFGLQGVVALLFGWFTLFQRVESLTTLVPVIGMFLLGLGIVELINLLCRAHLRETWGLTLAMAVLEIAAAFGLLFTIDQNNVFHLIIIAAYTVTRGLLEIALGFRAVDDRTDRFIWVLTGICGCVMGFVILNSGNNFVESVNFIKVFGAYLTLFGLSNLIYGVHNRDQAKEFAEYRRAQAKKNIAKKADAVKTIKSAKPVVTRPTSSRPVAVRTVVKSATRASKPAAKSTSKSASKSTAKSSKTTKSPAKKSVTKKSPAKKSTAKKTTAKRKR